MPSHSDFAGRKLIVAVAPMMLKRGEMVALRKWRQNYPQERLEHHPGLCIAFTWMHALSDELDQSATMLRFANRGMLSHEEETQERYKLEIHVVRSYVEIMKKNIPAAIECIEKSIQSDAGFSKYFMIGIELNMDEPYFIRSRLAVNGYLHKMHVLFTKCREVWKGSELPVLGYGALGLAELHYERNELEQLEYFVPRAIQLGKGSMNFGVLVSAFLTLARWRKAQKRMNEMWLAVEELDVLCRQHDASPHWTDFVEAFRVRLWIADNRCEEVALWVERRSLRACDEPGPPHEFESITLARALLFLNKNSEALKLLIRLKHEADVKDRLASRLECLILLSQAYFRQNRRKEMNDCLLGAVALAALEGYIRMFLDEPFPLEELLHKLFVNKSFAEDQRVFVAKVLNLYKQAPVIKPRSSSKLTNRELEVLALISEGLANSEIATRLHLSVGTVKGYVHHILNKLEASSRTQAAVIAKEMLVQGNFSSSG